MYICSFSDSMPRRLVREDRQRSEGQDRDHADGSTLARRHVRAVGVYAGSMLLTSTILTSDKKVLIDGIGITRS
jgi:hypothetical protein